MIRHIGLVCLTFVLVLAQAATNEADAQQRNLTRHALDKLRQDPVIVKVGVINEGSGSVVLDLGAEDFIIEEKWRQAESDALSSRRAAALNTVAHRLKRQYAPEHTIDN